MKIDRNADVISGSEDLELLYRFRNFPVFMGCTSAPQHEDVIADMSFWISPKSGMIQINPLLPLDVLYPEAHGAGMVGNLWAKHHQALAEFIDRFNPASVLEVGGGHGILATNYRKIKSIPWTILEPNPTPIPECKAEIIGGFFDENFQYPSKVDAIVHSHLFEHIYDPNLFIRNISEFLELGGKLIFSIPNMRIMLERKFTNCLNFEHTIYLSDTYAEHLLTRHGFRILEKKFYLNDHSIFYAAVRDNGVAATKLAPTLYEKNKSLYQNYVKFHEELVAKINVELKEKDDDIFLFGAHVQAQYLMGFGLNTSKIKAILDNDSKKHGKRLYGTDKLVSGPEVLKNRVNPIVIIRAGTFTSEIVSQIKIINPSTRFIL